MDFSPDIAAFCNYLSIFLVSCFYAREKINSRFYGNSIVWIIPLTWFLLSLYILLPIALFWFLDRSQAINDTSFFAALITAFGYEKIIAGNNGDNGGNGNKGMLGNFDSILAFADTVASRIADRIFKRGIEIRQEIVDEILKYEKYDELEHYVRVTADDWDGLKKRLEDRTNNRDDKYVKRECANLLYEEIDARSDSLDDVLEELYREDLVRGEVHFWNSPSNRLRGLSALVISAVIFIWFGGFSFISTDRLAVPYYQWRVEKQDTSNADLDRAKRALMGIYNENEGIRGYFIDSIVSRMQSSALPVKRADQYLKILLDIRCQFEPESYYLPLKLVDALNSPNVDIRMRVHNALLYFAESKPEALAQWKPQDAQSPVMLQDKIDAWRNYYAGRDSNVCGFQVSDR